MRACNCIGPQNGRPLCPCKMRGVEVRGGHYFTRSHNLGPVQPQPIAVPVGCICPVGAERTCQGSTCPRRKRGPFA